ncbi:4-oxalocrotonate tautomerase family protein [Paraburkholderia megapolitana]
MTLRKDARSRRVGGHSLHHVSREVYQHPFIASISINRIHFKQSRARFRIHPARTAETTERSRIMPFVSIRITREGVTAEQKAQVIKEVTDTLERVLHKPPEWTHIVIEEVDTDNWGFGGRTTTAIRKEQAG